MKARGRYAEKRAANMGPSVAIEGLEEYSGA
jgi:hypothetical protein